MTELKPCPCGEVPETFSYVHNYDSHWHVVAPDCCGQWLFQAYIGKNDPLVYGSTDYDLVMGAWWNAMPRAGDAQ